MHKSLSDHYFHLIVIPAPQLPLVIIRMFRMPQRWYKYKNMKFTSLAETFLKQITEWGGNWPIRNPNHTNLSQPMPAISNQTSFIHKTTGQFFLVYIYGSIWYDILLKQLLQPIKSLELWTIAKPKPYSKLVTRNGYCLKMKMTTNIDPN